MRRDLVLEALECRAAIRAARPPGVGQGLSLHPRQKATLEVDGRVIRLAPGMNLTAEIKTGRRLVIDYLLSPVRQAVGRVC